MTTTSTDRSADQDFIVRLAALQHSRDRSLSALRRWSPDGSEPQQLADVARATQGERPDDFLARAIVGRMFATWHGGKASVSYGWPEAGLGRALRRVGSAGQGCGPRNPAVERLVNQIVTAETAGDLTVILARAGEQLKPDSPPPHWETLLADVRQWLDPAHRDTVRVRWTQQFYTNPPKSPATSKKAK